MTTKLNDVELKELATQLQHPNGENGIMIGHNMNENNIKMTESSILKLDLKQNEQILELGHGNCGHLNYVLKQATNLGYIGLEISELMQKEAIKKNNQLLSSDIRFELFDGKTIPFYEKRFDKIFTVNTIYFWEDGSDFLREIYRVLKSKGKFTLTFSTKDFMQTLPFTRFGFNLYSEKEVVDLLKLNLFKIESITKLDEDTISKTGESVSRKSIIITCYKE